jgi:hypothetical protein
MSAAESVSAVTDDGGVVANARLTGMTGAVLFVLLAAEGLTILRVHSLIGVHVFIGMVVVPLAVLKAATTGYRFVRYYRGDPRYVRKGPPPLVLRILGPFVVALTFAVLASGIVAAIDGPGTRWLFVHKATFVVWFGVMTVHVLGHVVETGGLAVADFSHRRTCSGAATRVTVLVIVLAIGVILGVATRGWTDAWHALAPL